MANRPLLRLGEGTDAVIPARRGGAQPLRKPALGQQRAVLGPRFERLERILAQNPQQLVEDPASLAPERVAVFEVADSIEAFRRFLERDTNFEYLASAKTTFEPDERFSLIDQRKASAGQDRTDKPVPGTLYYAVPDRAALRQLVSLWKRWESGEDLGPNWAGYRGLFTNLKDLRPWGPQDRIPQTAQDRWADELETTEQERLRVELDLWFKSDSVARQTDSASVRSKIESIGGFVLQEIDLPEIQYHAMLGYIPVKEIDEWVHGRFTELALADPVMYLRPQSILVGISRDIQTEQAVDRQLPPIPPGTKPIVALFDGLPVSQHNLLKDRLIIDDPEGLEEEIPVSQRVHGTEMASLLLHGDLATESMPIPRPIYVRPILRPQESDIDGISGEVGDPNRLVVDTIYEAVIRMKGTQGVEGAAPSVFVVNLSLSVPIRPFAGEPSPLARLLDYLSYRFDVLFVVSAGNITTPITISDFDRWSDYEDAEPIKRGESTLNALSEMKAERTILSPAESVNALTIGAAHRDSLSSSVPTMNADPFHCEDFPNPSSGLGLGLSASIKPDLLMPGGKELVKMVRSGDELHLAPVNAVRAAGLKAASVNASSPFSRSETSYTGWTSGAAALATHQIQRIFEELFDQEAGFNLQSCDPAYYAVIMKALLAHSACWKESAHFINRICGPSHPHQHIARSENVSRFLGYGLPEIDRVLECEEQEVTFVGYGSISSGQNLKHAFPIPKPLLEERQRRTVDVTLAWISPPSFDTLNYRSARLGVRVLEDTKVMLGVDRESLQPNRDLASRGTLFKERLSGEKAVPTVDDSELSFVVSSKIDSGNTNAVVRYAVLASVRTEASIPLYQLVRDLVMIRAATSVH